MSDVSMRFVSAADMAVLAHIYGESFDEPYPEPVAHSLLVTPGAWGMIATTGTAEDAPPAGFVIARVIVDELEILSLGVLPGLRRRGVAKCLLSHAFAEAVRLGARIAHLEVGEDNPGAIALYRETGFDGVGRRPGYYRRADRTLVAAVLMSRLLKMEQ